jgi:hypothetical protein
MVSFNLSISTGNAAFKPDAQAEIARIIREAAKQLEAGVIPVNVQVRDHDGNVVGRCISHNDSYWTDRQLNPQP